ncbi:binding mitochondrial carrier protein SCaMC [Seminavis robusta]|uniref:Binding mitochondrial carrier protein SCaMC n=1 Tax=Seminavis robusta TaxID=568900 RepID=A0A9N8EIR7_9STRA|nr:binding mitochondrial carrier protein SCaMC [Seminavis robusta]|eukprot:Sro1063_g237130.1 binding mitochondrial carrier protein SCaMC (355) ;mRNA; f:25365-26516
MNNSEVQVESSPAVTLSSTNAKKSVSMDSNSRVDKETNSDKQQISTSDMTRRMVCGGVAGMVAKTATNPLERIKMLSQTGEHGMETRQRPSIVSMYRNIIQKEGVLGLWAGNGANLVRIFPAKAVVFSTNDMYKSIFSRLSGSESGAVSFLAGGFAGMTASALTYPLDFARGRISGKLAGAGAAAKTGQPQQSIRPTKEYSGITRTIVITIKDEGLLALYKGVTPTLIGALPYEGIKFGTVGLLEQLFPTQPDQPASYYVTRKMFMGGLGGVMAGLITYPNDTVRRMLQMQGSRGTTAVYSGYWDCARQIYQNHGIARLYSGLLINTIRMLPNVAIQFGSYELLKRWTAKANLF